MATTLFNSIEDEIRSLKQDRNAVILAHNYQVGEIQDIADYLGDSLNLARYAQRSNAEVIVFCGVHFMAETAAILCPDKKILIPDLAAGCSLADMVTPEEVQKWKLLHPEGVVVAYVNTSAAVKAEADYCCTSSNAEKVVLSIPEDKEILFIPDFFLGSYVKQKTGRNIHLWKGYCGAHSVIRSEKIEQLRREHPKAEFIMHPECGCTTKSIGYADKVLSTEGMIQYACESPSMEFIVATETGVLHRMQKDNPNKKFYAGSEQAVCSFMKQNTLEKIVLSLEKMQFQITVPEDIARRARRSLDRMVSIV
jgi:quinolinate synthase